MKIEILNLDKDFLERSLKHAQASSIDAVSAQLKAEDDTRLWRSRADSAEADRDKMRDELTTVLKQQSNWQAQMTGAPHVPFPEAYTPPPAPPLAPEGERQSPRPMTLRDMQRSAIMKSRMEAAERFKTHSATGE